MSNKNLCLNMIVKDETPVITRCLDSLVGFIDRYVIVDTGSSDGTPEMIKAVMDKNGIPGTVYERPWVSFEYNRNEALGLAYDDKESHYAMFIDADEIFHCDNSLDKEKLVFTKNPDYLLVEKRFGGMRYALPAIINLRSSTKWKWTGVVHEALVPASPEDDAPKNILKMESCHISARHGEGVRSRGKTLEEKFLADAKILEDDLEKNPDNTRHRFYLAQSYRDAGKYEKAYENYKKRSTMSGWHEEVYYSHFQMGALCLRTDNYKDAVFHMLEACKIHKPRIAEPFFSLMRYCRKNDMLPEASLWGQLGAPAVRKPSRDILFVPHDIYEWGFIDEYSITLAQGGKPVPAFTYMNTLMHKQNIAGDVRERIFKNIILVLGKIPALAKPETN